VSLGFELVAEQRAVALALEAWGQNSATARRMLRTFEEMLDHHIDDLETARIHLTRPSIGRALKETRAYSKRFLGTHGVGPSGCRLCARRRPL